MTSVIQCYCNYNGMANNKITAIDYFISNPVCRVDEVVFVVFGVPVQSAHSGIERE